MGASGSTADGCHPPVTHSSARAITRSTGTGRLAQPESPRGTVRTRSRARRRHGVPIRLRGSARTPSSVGGSPSPALDEPVQFAQAHEQGLGFIEGRGSRVAHRRPRYGSFDLRVSPTAVAQLRRHAHVEVGVRPDVARPSTDSEVDLAHWKRAALRSSHPRLHEVGSCVSSARTVDSLGSAGQESSHGPPVRRPRVRRSHRAPLAP